jgi:hypothetical protein
MTRTQQNALVAFAVVAAVAVTLMPDAAHAQAAGGGGGQLDDVIQWVVTNIGRAMINVGVIAIAILALCLRVSIGVVVFVACGGLILANYATIAGMFPI